MLLREILNALKQAIKNKDKDAIKRYRKILNNNGMDNNTINILLSINY